MGLETAADWTDHRRARAAAHLSRLADRRRIVDSYSHPAELAKACDPDYVVTPAIELMSRNVERALRSRRKRLMITAPPQEGKSTLCAVWTPLRALQLHPGWRVMLLTYADGLAEEHSRTARAIIQEFGAGASDALTGEPLPDRLGLSLSEDKATASHWRIREGDGGLVAAGRDATITGRRADLLIIDDPFKNMQEADSAAIRAKVISWYHSVASTRLSPGASVIFINTRWHPEDLSGHLLSHDREQPVELREWRYLNIPAVAHAALPDALGREHGTPLESARGRTREDFASIERNVGARVWNALYQGSPTPPEGGLFSGAWFDAHRFAEMPERTRMRIVAVDPSESGEGDEAGIIGASLLYPPSATAQALAKVMGDPDAPAAPVPQVLLTHDRSFQATSDQWATAAVQLAVDTWATEIFVETYTAANTYLNVVKSHITERIKRETDPDVVRHLRFLVSRVRGWRGTGDSVARSGLLRQAVEVGTCCVLGHELADMEVQARNWQSGSHQPDRVAAAVIAHDRLMYALGSAANWAAPVRRDAPGRNQWLDRKVG